MMTMPRRSRGFTLIELMIGVTIMALLLAVGIPSMRLWMTTTKANAAAEFYAEGMRMARAEALKRNVVSRLTLKLNPDNGQQDWQVDICLPTSTAKCDDDTGPWSTTTTPLAGSNVSDFKSVFRVAKNFPATSQMVVTRVPTGADDVYFTPVGWVNGAITTNLTQVTVAPAPGNQGAFPTTAVVLTGAGSVIKCNPDVAGAKDSRKCPT